MTTPKHSPAPWSYDIEHGATTFLVFNKDNYIIARHVNSTSDEEGRRTVEEAEANAKLICAAPEFLALAKKFLTEHENGALLISTGIIDELKQLVEKTA